MEKKGKNALEMGKKEKKTAKEKTQKKNRGIIIKDSVFLHIH